MINVNFYILPIENKFIWLLSNESDSINKSLVLFTYKCFEIRKTFLYREGGGRFNATFNKVSVISWWSLLLVEETKSTQRIPPTCGKSLANYGNCKTVTLYQFIILYDIISYLLYYIFHVLLIV